MHVQHFTRNAIVPKRSKRVLKTENVTPHPSQPSFSINSALRSEWRTQPLGLKHINIQSAQSRDRGGYSTYTAFEAGARRSLDELRRALGAAEHLRALIGRGKLLLVVPVGRAGDGGRLRRRRRPRHPQPLLGTVRAVDLARLLSHGREQVLRAFMRRTQRQRPLFQSYFILERECITACLNTSRGHNRFEMTAYVI